MVLIITLSELSSTINIQYEQTNHPKVLQFSSTKYQKKYHLYHGIIPPKLDLNHLKILEDARKFWNPHGCLWYGANRMCFPLCGMDFPNFVIFQFITPNAWFVPKLYEDAILLDCAVFA